MSPQDPSGPAAGEVPLVTRPLPTFMTPAVIALFTGPWPLAVVAIHHALSVKVEWGDGNQIAQTTAIQHSRKARNWVIWTCVLAILMWTTGLVVLVRDDHGGGTQASWAIILMVVVCVVAAATLAYTIWLGRGLRPLSQ